MANIKISELTEATLPLDGTEDLEIVQSGATKRCSTQDIADLAGGIQKVKVTISSAEILALNTTPKTIVSAPGAGKVIRPLSVYWKLNAGGSAYATNTTVQLHYDTLSGNLASVNSLLALTSNTESTSLPSTGQNFIGSSPANKALVVDVANGDPTAGNGTLDVYVSYIVITL